MSSPPAATVPLLGVDGADRVGAGQRGEKLDCRPPPGPGHPQSLLLPSRAGAPRQTVRQHPRSRPCSWGRGQNQALCGDTLGGRLPPLGPFSPLPRGPSKGQVPCGLSAPSSPGAPGSCCGLRQHLPGKHRPPCRGWGARTLAEAQLTGPRGQRRSGPPATAAAALPTGCSGTGPAGPAVAATRAWRPASPRGPARSPCSQRGGWCAVAGLPAAKEIWVGTRASALRTPLITTSRQGQPLGKPRPQDHTSPSRVGPGKCGPGLSGLREAGRAPPPNPEGQGAHTWLPPCGCSTSSRGSDAGMAAHTSLQVAPLSDTRR